MGHRVAYLDEVRALHAQGLRPVEIARRLGKSPLTIRRLLDRLGLERTHYTSADR